jgi:hypothetical protein
MHITGCSGCKTGATGEPMLRPCTSPHHRKQLVMKSSIHTQESDGTRRAVSGVDDVRVRVLGRELPLTLRVEDAARLVGVGRSSMC